MSWRSSSSLSDSETFVSPAIERKFASGSSLSSSGSASSTLWRFFPPFPFPFFSCPFASFFLPWALPAPFFSFFGPSSSPPGAPISRSCSTHGSLSGAFHLHSFFLFLFLFPYLFPFLCLGRRLRCPWALAHRHFRGTRERALRHAPPRTTSAGDSRAASVSRGPLGTLFPAPPPLMSYQVVPGCHPAASSARTASRPRLPIEELRSSILVHFCGASTVLSRAHLRVSVLGSHLRRSFRQASSPAPRPALLTSVKASPSHSVCSTACSWESFSSRFTTCSSALAPGLCGCSARRSPAVPSTAESGAQSRAFRTCPALQAPCCPQGSPFLLGSMTFPAPHAGRLPERPLPPATHGHRIARTAPGCSAPLPGACFPVVPSLGPAALLQLAPPSKPSGQSLPKGLACSMLLQQMAQASKEPLLLPEASCLPHESGLLLHSRARSRPAEAAERTTQPRSAQSSVVSTLPKSSGSWKSSATMHISYGAQSCSACPFLSLEPKGVR